MERNILLRKFNLLSLKFSHHDRNLAVIKSNLMFKCEELAHEEGLTLDNGQMCCKWCLNVWTPGTCNITLQPQKHPKRHMRSLLKKDVRSLNKFQEKLVTKLKNKSSANSLVFKCCFCSKNTTKLLKKEIIEPRNEEKGSIECEEIRKKKKRKKKDIFAGLNAAVVQNYKKSTEAEGSKKPEPIRRATRKPPRNLTLKQQVNIYHALSQVPLRKKKPSLLATFLDSM